MDDNEKTAARPRVRKMTTDERAKWSRAIHRAMRDDMLPALRAAYAMLTPFIDEACPTMYTDCHFRVGIGPKFLDQLSDEQAAFVMMHETMHNTQRHLPRQASLGLPQMHWNIVADLEINSMLASGVCRIDLDTKDALKHGGGHAAWCPPGILLPGQDDYVDCPPGLTAEAYVKYVPSVEDIRERLSGGDDGGQDGQDGDNGQQGDVQPQNGGEETQKGRGDAGAGTVTKVRHIVHHSDGRDTEVSPDYEQTVDSMPEPGIWDEVDRLGIRPISRADEARTIEHVQHDIAEFRKSHKSYGYDAGDALLTAIVNAMRPPKVDWRNIMRNVVSNGFERIRRGRDDYSFVRPNRRHMYDDSFIEPSFVSYTPRILYAIDTSGSMANNEDLRNVLVEAQGILRETGGTLDCICVDTEVKGRPRTFGSVQELAKNMRGGGGTDMSVALQMVDRMPKKRRPDMLVVATDGYWSWPAFAESLKLPGVRSTEVVVLIVDPSFADSWNTGDAGMRSAIANRCHIIDASKPSEQRIEERKPRW